MDGSQRGRNSGRRGVSPLSLAFLDVMFCGFGAVILIFLILDHTNNNTVETGNPDLILELNLLQEEIREGLDGNLELRNLLAAEREEFAEGEVEYEEQREQLQMLARELELFNANGADSDALRERLRVEIESLREQIEELRAGAIEQAGGNVRRFIGGGNRQYLSGMYLGGQRILILMDSSASMLDETIVNILRSRNMPDELKVQAPKWQWLLRTMEWIIAQIPVTSRYQIWTFNTDVQSAAGGDLQTWLEIADRDQLNQAMQAVRETVPNDGTNLEQVFRLAANMSPPPDNIFLITDGLPTVDRPGPADNRMVNPRRRSRMFDAALEELPEGVPVNTILLPLEGDTLAAGAYWKLAMVTRGSFLAPSRDWP